MSSFDTNINNYTIPELLAILQLDDPTDEEVLDTTNYYYNKFNDEDQSETAAFFKNAQIRLLEYLDGTDFQTAQNNEWYTKQYLTQYNNPTQTNKITEREQKIQVYNDNHLPMKREKLGVSNTYQTPVAQDTLNPNLKNITSRFINIDSQYRQSSGTSNASSTDFTLDLSDPLTNVLNLRLYSFQIPYTWYVIDTAYGNTCFWVCIPLDDGDNVITVQINIQPGNYATADFIIELNRAFNDAGITTTVSGLVAATYNNNNGKITININGWIYTDPSTGMTYTIQGITQSTDIFDSTKNPYFIFFDYSGQLSPFQNNNYTCNSQNASFGTSLGWLMGYRIPIQPILNGSGNTALCILDLYGPKYFIIVLDDYNQNHINNGLITITELPAKIDLPSYYTPTQPVICGAATPTISSLQLDSLGALGMLTPQQANALGINLENIGNLLEEKSTLSFEQSQTVITTTPRTLTQAQLYTINQSIKSRSQNTSFKIKPPNVSDTFAIVPLKKGGMKIGDVYVEFSGSLQDNKRIYFGPVNIDRMHIKLIDDRGFTVNLNGVDWCITIISENLYQY